MLKRSEREALEGLEGVWKVTLRQKPESQDPQHDVEIWTQGNVDLTPALTALGLTLISAHGNTIRSTHPTIWLAMKLPEGSWATTTTNLWALWNCKIIPLFYDGKEITPGSAIIAEGTEVEARAMSGNVYALRKIGSDAYIMRAVDIVYDLEGDA